MHFQVDTPFQVKLEMYHGYIKSCNKLAVNDLEQIVDCKADSLSVLH